MSGEPSQAGQRCLKELPASELVVYRHQGQLCCVLLEEGKPAEVLRLKEACEIGSTQAVWSSVDPIGKSNGCQAWMQRQNLLLGQVRQVLPALGCAFVDIGDGHDALLPLGDVPAGVKSGQSLIVQIRRHTPDHKGHRVTTRVELPGPYAVLLPHDGPRRRSKLRGLPAADQERLYRHDLERLSALWQSIRQQAKSGPVPRLLHAFGDPCHMALITWAGPALTRIRTEDTDLYQILHRLLTELMPEYLPLLHHQRKQGDYGLAAVLGLTDLETQLQRRQVRLDLGGSLVIDTTEALTAIDVNSGHDTRGRNSQALRLRTNLQAAGAIARQLRLRNCGGMVIIDFLRMKRPEDQQQVLAEMRKALTRDRARIKVYGFTAMGLFELVRSAV